MKRHREYESEYAHLGEGAGGGEDGGEGGGSASNSNNKKNAQLILGAMVRQYEEMSPADLQFALYRMVLAPSHATQLLQQHLFRRLLKRVREQRSARAQAVQLGYYLDMLLRDKLRVRVTGHSVNLFYDPDMEVEVSTLVHPRHLLLLRAVLQRPFDLFDRLCLETCTYTEYLPYPLTEAQESDLRTWRMMLVRHLLAYVMELTRVTETLPHTENRLLAEHAYMRPYKCALSALHLLQEAVQIMVLNLYEGQELQAAQLVQLHAPRHPHQAALLYMHRLLTALLNHDSARLTHVSNVLACRSRDCMYCAALHYRMQVHARRLPSLLEQYEERVQATRREEVTRQQAEADEDADAWVQTMAAGQFSHLGSLVGL